MGGIAAHRVLRLFFFSFDGCQCARSECLPHFFLKKKLKRQKNVKKNEEKQLFLLYTHTHTHLYDFVLLWNWCGVSWGEGNDFFAFFLVMEHEFCKKKKIESAPCTVSLWNTHTLRPRPLDTVKHCNAAHPHWPRPFGVFFFFCQSKPPFRSSRFHWSLLPAHQFWLLFLSLSLSLFLSFFRSLFTFSSFHLQSPFSSPPLPKKNVLFFLYKKILHVSHNGGIICCCAEFVYNKINSGLVRERVACLNLIGFPCDWISFSPVFLFVLVFGCFFFRASPRRRTARRLNFLCRNRVAFVLFVFFS